MSRRPYRGKLFPLDRAIQLRHDGLKLEDIAFAIGYSRPTVRWHLHKIGLSCGVAGKRARFGRFFPIEEVKRLYLGGLCQREIAVKLGYTKGAIQNQMRRMDIVMRPRGGDNRKKTT